MNGYLLPLATQCQHDDCSAKATVEVRFQRVGRGRFCLEHAQSRLRWLRIDGMDTSHKLERATWHGLSPEARHALHLSRRKAVGA